MVLGGLAKAKDKDKDKESQPGKLRYFSTKSVAKAVPKIESTRVRTRVTISSKKDDLRVQTEHVEREQLPELYLPREKEFLYPFVLVFKAYG